MKIPGRIGLAGVLALFCAGAWARSPMSCDLAGTLAEIGGKKVYAANANLRCPTEANAIEIEKISADARIVDSPQPLTRVTLNWDYVYRRKPSSGAVTFDVYGGTVLLESCPTTILQEDFSDTSSGSDSAECELPLESYTQIDRVVVRIQGSHR